MSWFFLTIISVIFRAIYGVLTKVLSNKVNVSIYTQSTLLPLSAALITLAASPFLGGINLDFTGLNIPIFMLMIACNGLGNVVYFAAIKSLTSATAQITFSSILVFNTVLSLIFFNLHLSLLNIIGLILLSLAIILVINGKLEFNKKGVLLMTLSALIFAIYQLTSAIISKELNSATYLFFTYAGTTSIVFLFKFKQVVADLPSIKLNKNALIIPAITSLPSLGNYIFAYYAYRIAPRPPIVAMLLTSQVVVAVILSYIFLNEKDHVLKKVSAAIMVVISAILIKG